VESVEEGLKEKDKEARGSSARAKGVRESEGEVLSRVEGIKALEVAEGWSSNVVRCGGVDGGSSWVFRKRLYFRRKGVHSFRASPICRIEARGSRDVFVGTSS